MAFPFLPDFPLSRKPVPSFMRRPEDYFTVFISSSKYWQNLVIETVGSGLGPFGLFPRPPLRPAQVKCSSQSLPIIPLSAFWISPNFHHRCCSNLPADPLGPWWTIWDSSMVGNITMPLCLICLRVRYAKNNTKVEINKLVTQSIEDKNTPSSVSVTLSTMIMTIAH